MLKAAKNKNNDIKSFGKNDINTTHCRCSEAGVLVIYIITNVSELLRFFYSSGTVLLSLQLSVVLLKPRTSSDPVSVACSCGE